MNFIKNDMMYMCTHCNNLVYPYLIKLKLTVEEVDWEHHISLAMAPLVLCGPLLALESSVYIDSSGSHSRLFRIWIKKLQCPFHVFHFSFLSATRHCSSCCRLCPVGSSVVEGLYCDWFGLLS